MRMYKLIIHITKKRRKTALFFMFVEEIKIRELHLFFKRNNQTVYLKE